MSYARLPSVPDCVLGDQGGGALDGQEHRDRIKAELSGMTASDGPQNTSIGSFAFTESDIRQLITNWLDIAKSYDRSITTAIYVTQVTGPGLDFASDSFANKANQSGESLLQHLRHGWEYSIQQAQLAQTALDDYLGVEHTNVMNLYKAQHGERTEV